MPDPTRVDDPTITDDTFLLRGVERHTVKEDDSPSYGAFISHEVSVSISTITSPTAVIAKGTAMGYDWRVWRFTAEAVRKVGCIIVRDPQPNDPGHALIFRGDEPGKRLKDSQGKTIVREGQWTPV